MKSKISQSIWLSGTILATGGICTSGPAIAQAASLAAAAPPAKARPADNDTTVVMVTARRRSEKLQDVPVAITAITAVAIERQGLTGLADVTRAAPSVNVTPSAGGGRQIPLFTIRGQRQGDTLASVDPSVGIYVGDQLLKRAYGLDQITFDMGSIQVLKGPQGTLFGLNTTGGNIIFTPNQPVDRFAASLKAGVGNFNDRSLDGFVNIPLGSDVALRIAGHYEKRDGYIKDVVTGQDDQNLNGGGVRVGLKITPNDNLQSSFTAGYLTSSTNGTGFHLNGLQATTQDGMAPTSLYSPVGYPPATLAAELAVNKALGFYQVDQNGVNYAKTKPAWNVANTTTYKINDSISLKNILGTRGYTADYFEDFDGSALSFLQYGNKQVGKEFSEEFQILGSTEALNWILGAYYFKEKVDAYSYTTALISPAFNFFYTPYKNEEKIQNTTKSLFASGTQKLDGLVNGLSLTVGARYTWDTRKANFGTIYQYGTPSQYCGFSAAPTPANNNYATGGDPNILNPVLHLDPGTCLIDVAKDFSKLTYSLSLDWKFAPGKLVYIAHRRGYRAGGFGTRATTSAQVLSFDSSGNAYPSYFRPESVKDAEVGTKLDFKFDNGAFLRTNIAAYGQDYADIQRLVPFSTPGGGVATNVVNAAKATIKGFEFEGTFDPVKWLELTASVAHTDPQYKSFIAGGVDVSKVATFAGSSHWQDSASVRLKLPTPQRIGEAAVQLSYYHQSSFAGQDNADTEPFGQTPGYSVVNSRFELNDVGGRPLDLDVFANNLANRKYANFNFGLQYNIGFGSYVAGPPRMYGVELRYHW